MNVEEECQFLRTRRARKDIQLEWIVREKKLSLKFQALAAVVKLLADLAHKARTEWTKLVDIRGSPGCPSRMVIAEVDVNDEPWMKAKQYLRFVGQRAPLVMVELRHFLFDKEPKPFVEEFMYSVLPEIVQEDALSQLDKLLDRVVRFKKELNNVLESAFIIWWLLWDENCDPTSGHPLFSTSSHLHEDFNDKVTRHMMRRDTPLESITTWHFTSDPSKLWKYRSLIDRYLPNLERIVLHRTKDQADAGKVANEGKVDLLNMFVDNVPNLKSIIPYSVKDRMEVMQPLSQTQLISALAKRSKTLEFLDFTVIGEYVCEEYGIMASMLNPFTCLKKLVLPKFDPKSGLPALGGGWLVPNSVEDLEVTADTLEQYTYFAKLPSVKRLLVNINLINEWHDDHPPLFFHTEKLSLEVFAVYSENPQIKRNKSDTPSPKKIPRMAANFSHMALDAALSICIVGAPDRDPDPGPPPVELREPILGALNKWFRTATKITCMMGNLIVAPDYILPELENPVLFDQLTHMVMSVPSMGHDTFMNLVFCSPSLVHLHIKFKTMAGYDFEEFSESVQRGSYRGLKLTSQLNYVKIQPLIEPTSASPLKFTPYDMCVLLAGVDRITDVQKLKFLVLPRPDVRLLFQTLYHFPSYDEDGYIARFDKSSQMWLTSFRKYPYNMVVDGAYYGPGIPPNPRIPPQD